MMKTSHVLSLAVCVVVSTAVAGDYPLEFKSLDARGAFAFPGGYGVNGSLKLAKPSGLTKEPKAVSANPIYGEFTDPISSKGMIFRLDEPAGDGKGYDALVIDLNQNGDLTDDKVFKIAPAQGAEREEAVQNNRSRFGPIQFSETKTIAGGKPIYFAECYIYNRDFKTAKRSEYSYLGYLRFKAGWYLEGTAEFGADKRKVALFDGNSNGKLGDLPVARYYTNDDKPSWYVTGGDVILVDENASGTYETSVLTNEVYTYGSPVYYGAMPYKATPSEDLKSIRIEPFAGPLAAVDLKPYGEQVSAVTLAWEETKGNWRQLRPGVTAGKIKVPPGSYRLLSCTLAARSSSGARTITRGYKRTVEPMLTIEADKTNMMLCGAPLEVKVTTKDDVVDRVTSSSSGIRSFVDRIGSWMESSTEQKKALRINAEVVGQGQEVYSYYSMGDDNTKPPRPSFTIASLSGKEIASGNLEFG